MRNPVVQCKGPPDLWAHEAVEMSAVEVCV